MFTGIVETVGRVTAVGGGDSGRRFTFEAPSILDELSIGDSISVNGVCLTAVATDPPGFDVEAVVETLRRTNLGSLTEGALVNLERAMPGSGRFDGHIVQGHVDGTGTIADISAEGDGERWTIGCESGLLRYVVEKGSITVDGVSLTVAALVPGGFQIALIPHTLAVTTFGESSAGDAVNLEVDILAKYVERLLESRS